MDLVKFEEVANDYNVARAAFAPARNALIAFVWGFIEKTAVLTDTFDYKFRNESNPKLSKYMGLKNVKLYFVSSISDNDFYVDVDARKVYIEAYAEMGTLDYCENFTFEEISNAEKTLTDAYAAWVKKANAVEAKSASKAEADAAKKALAAYNKFKEKGYYAS